MSFSSRLLTTKLYRPRPDAGLVPRPRLLAQLQNWQERPLILVSAPAGYGKTTLVSSWLESCDCPNAWLSVDEEDDALLPFLTYFLAAVGTIFPQAVADMLPLPDVSNLPPLSVLARNLINNLDRIDEPFILVLDDYHHIHNITVHDLLDNLLTHPPHSMHLVLLSRTDPPLNLATLRARRQMIEIRTNDLRFTREEAAALVRREMHTRYDDEALDALLKRVEGWAAGIRLITLSLRHRGSMDLGLPGQVAYVADYLLAEVVESQPRAIQHYLLSTAILDRFCASLADAVCSGEAGPGSCQFDGQSFVTWLQENNVFVTTLDAQGEWVRYHPLLRELLQDRLKRQSAQEIADLHRRASDWFAQHRLVDEAIHHALAAGDTERAVRLVARHRHTLIDREQWQHLEHWLHHFNRETIESSAELSITEAWLMGHHALQEAQLIALERTERLLTETDIPPQEAAPIWGEVYVLRANIMNWLYRSTEACALIEQAQNLLPPHWQYAHSMACMVRSLIYASQGQVDQAEQTLLACLNEQQFGRESQHKPMLFYTLAHLRWISLDLPGLEQSAIHCYEYSQQHNLPETEIIARYFQACAYYHQNELDKARTYFDMVVNNPYRANRIIYPQAVYGLACTYRAMGRLHEAQSLLQASQVMLTMDHLNPQMMSMLQAIRAEMLLAQGDLGAATRWARSYNPHPILGLQMFYVPQFTYIRILLAQNTASSLETAETLLNQMIELARHNHFYSALLIALPLQALWHDRLGNETAALDTLEEAIRLGQGSNWIRVFVDLGQPMADLLTRQARSRSNDYVKRILAAFPPGTGERTRPRSASVPPLELVEPLTSREMQVLELLARRLTNKEIAERLFITPGTVGQHTVKIYQKLQVGNRRQAVDKARDLGILPPYQTRP